MIDVEAFTTHLGISKAELARRLGLDSKCNTLSLYAKGKSEPKFEMCKKLLTLGMSVEELFGTEIAKNVIVFRNKPEEKQQAPVEVRLDFKDPAVQQAVSQAVSDALRNAAQSLSDKG